MEEYFNEIVKDVLIARLKTEFGQLRGELISEDRNMSFLTVSYIMASIDVNIITSELQNLLTDKEIDFISKVIDSVNQARDILSEELEED